MGDADTRSMQPARKAVGATRALIELAAGIQQGEDDLHHRHLAVGVQAEGDVAAFVIDADRAVGVQHQREALAVAGQCLVGHLSNTFWMRHTSGNCGTACA
jgi:hypothetical protein